MKRHHLKSLLKINIFFALMIFTACSAHRNRPRESELAGRYYQVRKGDTLAKISYKYRVKIEEIAEINGIENYENLRIGQNLYLPDPDPIGTVITKQKGNRPKKTTPKQINRKTKEKKYAFSFPVPTGKIIKKFSLNKKSPYEGLGIVAPLGTTVRAAQSGRVLFVGDHKTRYGLILIIEHQKPYITVYTHLASSSVKVEDRVKNGQTIGKLGNSGAAKTPHLHFQIRVNEKPQNPLNYITLPK